jgi:uncharacterized membrane protein YgdD (TMEM256/DUF423 family)
LKHNIIFIAGILAIIAVGLGAIGSHALKEILSMDQLMSFETGVRYQMYHALALLAIAALTKHYNSNYLIYAAWAFLIGTILFSFSIYLLSTREAMNAPWLIALGPITPFGGISLILGWLFFIIAGFEIKILGKKEK